MVAAPSSVHRSSDNHSLRNTMYPTSPSLHVMSELHANVSIKTGLQPLERSLGRLRCSAISSDDFMHGTRESGLSERTAPAIRSSNQNITLESRSVSNRIVPPLSHPPSFSECLLLSPTLPARWVHVSSTLLSMRRILGLHCPFIHAHTHRHTPSHEEQRS